MAARKWNSHMILDFLDIFEKYDILWDMDNANFKDRRRRAAALDVLLHELLERPEFEHLDIPTLKCRLKCIKTVYRQELNKVMKSKGSGCNPCDVYRPKLVWFEKANSYLYTTSLQMALEGETASTKTGTEKLFETFNEVSEEPTTTNRPPQPRTVPSISQYARQIAKKRKIDPFKGPVVLNTRHLEDQYEIFAKHIVSQLRQLPERSFVIVQAEVQKIISRERLRNLSKETVVYEQAPVQTQAQNTDVNRHAYWEENSYFESENASSPSSHSQSSPSSPALKCEVLDFEDYAI